MRADLETHASGSAGVGATAAADHPELDGDNLLEMSATDPESTERAASDDEVHRVGQPSPPARRSPESEQMAEISAEPITSGFCGGPEPHVNAALTDMHTYTLLLEGDGERLGRRLEGLAAAGGSSEEFSQLVARRAEIEEELEALRTTTAALRRQTVDGLPPEDERAGGHAGS